MRVGMWGPGFALPGDLPGAITLADCVLWAVFRGDLERAEALIAQSEEVTPEAQAKVPASARAPESDCVPPAGNRFRYRYAWNRMQRKGQRCAVLVRGDMNSCLVEFEDD